MAKHHETGKKAEALAAQILHHKGYEILHTNWRYGRREVDIIAGKDTLIVFVEVKSRSTPYFGHPAEALTERKENFLVEAAGHFQTLYDHHGPIRFDLIAILMLPGQIPQIDHYEDVFYPGI
jgi:putative endonuclease